jgi:hypothetical protein
VRVVASDNGAPVKRARVMFSGLATLPPASGAASQNQPQPSLAFSSQVPGVEGRGVAVRLPSRAINQQGETDEGGACTFAQLPAGSYTLMVAPQGGFVRQMRGQSVRLEDGQALTVNIRLDRTGAIVGRVTDETGDPIVRAQVRALRRDPSGLSGRLGAASMSSTNDLGEFRLFDLQPGEYYVVAEFPVSLSPTTDAGTGLAPTWYPGSSALDGAGVVTVRSGQDTAAIHFPLVRARLGRVSGTAVDSQGTPLASGSVSLSPRGESYAMGRGAAVRADGTFVIAAVPPGDYYVSATLTRGNGPEAYREGAYAPVSVNGDDVAVSLRTNTGATVAGKVLFEGDQPVVARAPTLLNGVPVARVQVVVRQASSGPTPSSASFSGSTPVRDDGTFELKGLRGAVLLQASGPGGLFRAVLRGGQDITGKPLELAGTERLDDVVLVLTSETGSLEGSVSDRQGRVPATPVVVIVFPDEPGRWFYSSPFVRSAQVLTEVPPMPASPPGTATPARALTPRQEVMRSTPVVGGFFVPQLLPGRYWVVPLDQTGGMPPSEREALEKLKARATSVTIKVGEKTRVALTVGK